MAQVSEKVTTKDRIHMLTLQCTGSCKVRLRIGRILNEPTTQTGALQYCSLCGGPAFVMTDSDETVWEILADSYKIPVEAIQIIYSMWNPNEHSRLSDFIETLKKEKTSA